MYFFADDPLRELERLMQRAPNFLPRGHGVIVLCRNECSAGDCACLKERMEAGAVTYRETIEKTLSTIRYPPFVTRLERYLKESEEHPMYFKNERHRLIFAEAVKKLNKKNHALMSAIYLLTADQKLWNTAKRYIGRNEIHFGSLHLRGSTENGYALYCAAKDIYLGTKNLTIGDLADTRLVPPRIFGLICNAMAIRRFGLGAVKFNHEKELVQ